MLDTNIQKKRLIKINQSNSIVIVLSTTDLFFLKKKLQVGSILYELCVCVCVCACVCMEREREREKREAGEEGR